MKRHTPPILAEISPLAPMRISRGNKQFGHAAFLEALYLKTHRDYATASPLTRRVACSLLREFGPQFRHRAMYAPLVQSIVDRLEKS